MARTRRTYSEDFRKKVLADVRSGKKTVNAIAKEHDIASSVIYNWQKTMPDVTPSPEPEEPEAQLTVPGTVASLGVDNHVGQLERENARLKAELRVLRQALGIVSRGDEA